jgi:hypothetical protein
VPILQGEAPVLLDGVSELQAPKELDMCNCGNYCPHCGRPKPVTAPWPGQYVPYPYPQTFPAWNTNTIPPVKITNVSNAQGPPGN